MNDGSSRWQRINTILEQVLDQPAGRREALVRDACGDDVALASEVLELLGHDLEESSIRTRMLAAMDDLIRDMGERASLIGTRIGAFVLTREIARGGMGQVYEARREDSDFEQTVAIKLLPGHRLNDEARLRFAIERQILAGLQHPNIAQLIDGGTLDDGMPYIVMEYVDGVRIDQYCGEQQLSNKAIIQLILQVCDAVQLAHRKLVVHRDIKPANILVDRYGTPKLLDFGIAKLLDVEGEASSEHTRTGLRLLTPAYASPEQIRGGDITTAVDVYALGLLTYLLLTHRLPYRADPADPHSLEQQILTEPPEAPSDAMISRERLVPCSQGHESQTPAWSRQQRRALKGEIDTILLNALRKEPERRYANVAAFSEDLRRHLVNRPIQARPESRAYRLKLFFKRHPVAAPVSVLAISTALVAGATFTWLLAEERDQALASEARAMRAAEFAGSLLSGTSAQEGAESLMPVSDLLDQAGLRIADELGDEPLIAVPLHLALGEANMSWARYQQGMEQAEAARAVAAATGLEREHAQALDLLARLTHETGDVDRALELSGQALEIFRRVGTLADRARALNGMAISLNEAGRREQALPMFEEAELALAELHDGDHPDIAWLMNNHGWALHALRRHDEAMQRYDQALAMLDRLNPAPFDRALTLSNRAGLEWDLGRPERAVRDWREALALLDSMFGEESHPGVARGHHLLATGLRELGRLDEALAHSRQAVALNRQLVGDQHRWTGFSLIMLAGILVDRGELEAASARIDETATLVETSNGTEHLDYSSVHLERGRLALAQGEYADAERHLRAGQALAEPLAAVERTSIDAIDWALAVALAAQNKTEGRALAESVAARLSERFGAEDWRVRLKRAGLALPPFSPSPEPVDIQRAAELVDELAGIVGPDAPRVAALLKQLQQSR